VDAFSLGLTYRSGDPNSPVRGTRNGELLTNQTTVIVDITIMTRWSGRQNTETHPSFPSAIRRWTWIVAVSLFFCPVASSCLEMETLPPSMRGQSPERLQPN
jgi:hypothetical protein